MRKIVLLFAVICLMGGMAFAEVSFGSAAGNIVWLDGRFVNTTGDTMTGDLSVESTVTAQTIEAQVTLNFGDTTVGDLVMDGTIEGTSTGTTLDIVPTAGNYTRIGDAGAAGYASANDDLYVSGKLEVDSSAYFDVGIRLYSNPYFINFNDSEFGTIKQSTDDGLKWTVGSTYQNKNIIITDHGNYTRDHDHDTLSANPTLFIHSSVNPDSNNTLWGSLAHTGTTTEAGDFVIASGSGDISLEPATGIVKAASFESTATTGTAPFTVASTTVVTNLNADQIDGHDWAEVATVGAYVPLSGGTMTGALTMSANVKMSSATIEGTSNGASLDIVPTAGDYLKVHSVLQVTQGLTVEGDVSVGGNYNMSFPIDLGTNPGFNTLFDSNITAAGTQSDEASVMFSIDHDIYIELHAENDGSGNLQEEYILLSKLLVISPEAVCPSFLGATPEGAVWADATNNKLKCYLGGAWNDLF